jgi:serine/threonine protein phosphatase 1
MPHPLAQQRDEQPVLDSRSIPALQQRFWPVVVHGHTPAPEPEICANRIDVDSGAYATGQLTCVVLERDQVGFV